MCGIIGIVSKEKKNVAPVLVGALSRLEYRGYDSAGIAVVGSNRLHILKCVGAPSEHLHANKISENGEDVLSTIGIGHNRWATHGKPTLLNAHPHTDEAKKVAVVHNGTILNYESLRKELQEKGIVFISETDTEVIPHLIATYKKEGLNMREAFLATLLRLEGAYGVVALDAEDPHTLYVAKEGSPIVIGVNDGEYYVASSIHGFLPFTDRFITLLDGEMAVLSIKEKADLQISRIKDSTSVQDRMFQTAVHTAASDLSKGDFETFMLKEIYEQPATTRTTLVGRTNDKEGIAVLGGLLDSEEFLINTKTFLFTGCGTAYNASVVGAYVMERIAGATVRTEIASEGRYKPLHTSVDTTAVFAVSQSGETADTLEYIKELKRKHYETYGIVNVVGSALSEITGKGIYTKAGSEIGVASTKAFTSQLVALYLLALYVARGKTMGIESGMQFVSNLESIPELMKNSFACVDDIKELVQKYKSFTKIQFLGRGIHVPVAQEASLKFKELTYFETGAYPLGELKHGPIAIVDKDTLSVVILPQDELFEHGVNSVEQIKSKDGKVLLITDESTRGHHICDKVDSVIYIPHIGDPLFYPFLEIIPLQLFAYYFAQMLGRNIDKPRNLAKSVTVQ